MTGVAISVVLIAIALSPYSERLGIAVVGNLEIGNPIEMGEGAGLIFLLATAQSGTWLYTRQIKWIRALIWMASLICLLLSTSRGGWLTVAGTLFVLCCSVRRERPKVLGAMAAIALVVTGLIASGHGSSVVKYFEKVASPDRTLSQKTTLRADQWVTVVRILNASPVFGAGVGEGFAANVTYGSQALIFHSLYLQIAAETGLLGLLILFVYLFRLITAARKHLRITSEAVPLLGCTGFMMIGLSVACFDPLSGIYLGLALLSGFPRPSVRLEEMRTGPGQLDRPAIEVPALCSAD
jgi:O-antigen ligase